MTKKRTVQLQSCLTAMERPDTKAELEVQKAIPPCQVHSLVAQAINIGSDKDEEAKSKWEDMIQAAVQTNRVQDQERNERNPDEDGMEVDKVQVKDCLVSADPVKAVQFTQLLLIRANQSTLGLTTTSMLQTT